MSNLTIRLLGPPRLELDGEVVPLGRRKALAMVAFLAVSGQRERRDTLAALLWPERDRGHALAALRRTLRSLTKALSGRFLAVSRSAIGLDLDSDLWIDVGHFLELLERSPSVTESNPRVWREALPELVQFAQLYRGNFLSGLTLRDAKGFDDWQRFEGERLHGAFAKGLERLVAGYRLLGEYDEAIRYAQRWLDLDNLSEEVHRTLMRLFSESGRRLQALRQYQRCADLLDSEIQVGPEPETTELYESIRDGRGVAGRGAGISRPDRRLLHRNLPEPPTAFVGRRSELSLITQRLRDPNCHLLTLVGPGGIGKTRLALEAARQEAGGFAEGVCFASLTNATPELLVSVVAEQLGLRLDPLGDAELQLLSHLRDREMLLLLDNFEHVIERAEWVSAILSSAEKLKIIATSRERLNLQSESLLEIRGLDVPASHAVENLESFSAVRLFVHAARRAEADFSLSEENAAAVVEICRLLSGMPLGIELAAAWLRLLDCRELLGEIENSLDFLAGSLRDIPERHRSLRAVFDSSLSMLTEGGSDLLCRLSCFHGGFSREAAEKVTSASLPALLGLLDKSLLSHTTSGRYQMHEAIRQFASELLNRNPEEGRRVRTRHATFYLGFLRHREDGLRGDRQKETEREVRLEIDNVRAAWRTAIELGMKESIDRSLEGLCRYYLLTNALEEGEATLAAAMATVSRTQEPLLWSRLATRQGRFCNQLARYEESGELLEESLAIVRRLRAPGEIAISLTALSTVSFHLGDFSRARQLAQESYELCRDMDDQFGMANALVQLGRVCGVSGQYQEAKERLRQGRRIFEKLGDRRGVGRCLINLGNCAYLTGDYVKGVELEEESLEIFRELEDCKLMAGAFCNLGLVHEEMGEHEKATEFCLRALELFRQIGFQEGPFGGMRLAPVSALETLGRANFGLRRLAESKRYFLEAVKTADKIGAVPEALIAMLGLARLMAHEGSTSKAWELLTFITGHSAMNDEGRLQARALLAELKDRLTPQQRAEAEKSGSQKRFEGIFREVIQTFELGEGPIGAQDHP